MPGNGITQRDRAAVEILGRFDSAENQTLPAFHVDQRAGELPASNTPGDHFGDTTEMVCIRSASMEGTKPRVHVDRCGIVRTVSPRRLLSY